MSQQFPDQQTYSFPRSYTSLSIPSSKYQTPLKSPSPDQSRMNSITPTKVKYIIQGKNIKGYELQNQKYNNKYENLHKGQYFSINSTPFKLSNGKSRKYLDQYNKQQVQQHIKQLQHQITILSIQNRNLLTKLQSSSSTKKPPIYPAPQPTNPSSSSIRSSTRQPNSLIIQKIKQQYDQQLNTLKLMIEQQIKQAVNVVQDMCQIMKNKIIMLQNRVQQSQTKLKQIKINKIIQLQQKIKQKQQYNMKTMQDKFNTTGKITHTISQKYQNTNNLTNLQQSISDILCISIPQQQQQYQQSRTHTITINNLHQQIQSLKNTIVQTQNQYHRQKIHLEQIIKNKNQDIYKLNNKVEEYQRKIINIQHKLSTNNNINNTNNRHNNINIRQQLQMLQKCVIQLSQQLTKNQQDHHQLTLMLQQKNIQTQSMSRQIIILRDKILDSQKQRILLLQKTKFLQGNIHILQTQLQQNKNTIQQLYKQKNIREQNKVHKIITHDGHKYNVQRNIVTLTSRIDKLMLLEEERQRQNEQQEKSNMRNFNIRDIQGRKFNKQNYGV